MNVKDVLTLLSILIMYSCTETIGTYEEAAKNCLENKETVQMIGMDGDTTEIKMISESCIEGYRLPDFNVNTINGENISSESLKGKLSVINFWFETCPPCIAEIPGLNQLVEEFGTQSINYLAISTDTNEDVIKFLQKNDFNFSHVADGDKLYRKTFAAKWGFPFTIITNRQNKILKSFGGGPADSTAVNEIINKIKPILIKEKAHKYNRDGDLRNIK